MLIVPSILTDSLALVQEQIDKTLSLGLGRVQIDIIDPDFADTITISPIDLLEIDLRGMSIDIHLMTNDPINDVTECSQVPGVRTIIAQIEHMSNQRDFVEHVKSYPIDPALSLDLYTQVDEIDPTLFSELSVVQVMGNVAGRQGQQFAGDRVLEKISFLSRLRRERGLAFQIAVDIGMTPKNAKLCAEVGADIITPGSYLWTSSSIQHAIEAYR